MEKIARFGVSLDQDLLKKFDELIEREGYISRSEALRDLIREKLVSSEIDDPDVEVVGSLTLLYNHDIPGLVNNLLELQHHSQVKIFATTHVHVDNHNCVEVLLTRGKAGDVMELANAIRAQRGVIQGKVVLTKSV